MKTTCIVCPVGCQLEISKVNDEVVVTGNECPRGKEYGKNEFTMPLRMLTTLAKTDKGVVSVKLSKFIPKEKIVEARKEIGKLHLTNPQVGDVVLKDVCGTGADVIVTGISQNKIY